jgi:hypothetical protein
MRAIPAVALAAVLLAAPDARAQWPAGGKPVLESNEHVQAADFFQHPSGNLFVKATTTANTSNGHSAALIQPTGEIVAGWPSYLTGTLAGYTYLHDFAVDDSGNVWHSWVSPSSPPGTRLELLTPGGLHDPSTYWALNPSWGATPTALAPGQAADAYTLLMDTRLQRTYRTGLKAASWPASGKQLPIALSFLNRIISDSQGGAIVLGMHPTLSTGVAVRVDSSSALHAGWPAGGLVLNTYPDFDYAADPGGSFLAPSGHDHFLAAWKVNLGSDALRSVRMQRFSVDGTLDPGWPAEGALVTPEDSLQGLTMLADGSGGAYVLWTTLAGPRGTHILADCTFPSGLDASGRLLLDEAAEYVQAQYYYAGYHALERLVASVRPDGGLLIAWGDSRLAPTVSYRVRWLQPDLLADPARPDDGLAVMPSGPSAADYKLRAIQAAPDDGAYVAWEDQGQFGAALWMTRVSAPVVVGVPLGGPSHALLLSAPRPNPSRGDISFDVSLAGDGLVRVELLDVAGRVLRSHELQGRGTQPVKFSGLLSLPAGLYFVRATTNGESQRTRVVLTR